MVNTTDLSRYMKKTNARLQFYAEKLETWGIIDDVDMRYGTMLIQLNKPRAWNASEWAQPTESDL